MFTPPRPLKSFVIGAVGLALTAFILSLSLYMGNALASSSQKPQVSQSPSPRL